MLFNTIKGGGNRSEGKALGGEITERRKRRVSQRVIRKGENENKSNKDIEEEK